MPDGKQWFKFTATAALQYLHLSFGAITNADIQVYDSDGIIVGTSAYPTSIAKTDSIKYTSRTLTTGQDYYIRVTAYNKDGGGTYQIAFNTSSSTPTRVSLPTDVAQLNPDEWIVIQAHTQWFRFTAGVSQNGDITNVLHVREAFTASGHLIAQLYESSGESRDTQKVFDHDIAGWSQLVPGQEYYLKLWGDSIRGSYKIAYSNTTYLPVTPVIQLYWDTWADGNVDAYGEQWFVFTATVSEPYQYIHVNFGTLVNLNVQIYEESELRFSIGGSGYLSSGANHDPQKSIKPLVTEGKNYYIKVSSNSPNGIHSSGGTFRIKFNQSAIANLYS